MENYEKIKELLEEYLNNENKNEDINIENLPYTDEKEVMVASRKACIKININDIPTHSRGAQGVKAIKLALKDSVIRLA